MADTIAPENTPPIASNQPATPAPTVKPQDDAATELAKIRQEKEDLAKRLEEKDKFINELSTEKATLESRLSGFQAVESVTEPKGEPKGGTPVSEYVRPEQIPEIVERTAYINKIREENKDVIDIVGEDSIKFRAMELQQQGKGFKESIATAIKEKREKIDKLKTPATPPPQTPPAGARGEDGAPVSLEPKVKPEEPLDDEGAQRIKLRQMRGL